MKNDALQHLLDRAIRRALEKLQSSADSAAIVDLYLFPNPEAGEFTVFDDEDHILEKTPVSVWQEQFDTMDTEAELKDCEIILGKIVEQIREEGLFEQLNIMKPFSVLMVDEEMETICELMLLDDEQCIIDDNFLKYMDEELDDFFKKLMSDI
jgi:hypothetical protein